MATGYSCTTYKYGIALALELLPACVEERNLYLYRYSVLNFFLLGWVSAVVFFGGFL